MGSTPIMVAGATEDSEMMRGRMRMDGAVNPDDFLAHQVRAGEAA